MIIKHLGWYTLCMYQWGESWGRSKGGGWLLWRNSNEQRKDTKSDSVQSYCVCSKIWLLRHNRAHPVIEQSSCRNQEDNQMFPKCKRGEENSLIGQNIKEQDEVKPGWERRSREFREVSSWASRSASELQQATNNSLFRRYPMHFCIMGWGTHLTNINNVIGIICRIFSELYWMNVMH